MLAVVLNCVLTIFGSGYLQSCSNADSLQATEDMENAPNDICGSNCDFFNPPQPLIDHLPVLHEINKILDDTPTCPDDAGIGVGNCALEKVLFQQKQGHHFSLGRRVLIIDWDEFPMVYTRYRQRVLDLIQPNDTGYYTTIKDPLYIVSALRKILSDTIGDRYHDLSVDLLRKMKLSRKIREKFKKEI